MYFICNALAGRATEATGTALSPKSQAKRVPPVLWAWRQASSHGGNQTPAGPSRHRIRGVM